MFLIRTISIAQPMRRSDAVALIKEMSAAMEKDLGHPKTRILTGSIGLSDSTVIMETEYESLAKFEQDLDSINGWSGMAKFGERYAQLFAAGGNRFEICRIQ